MLERAGAATRNGSAPRPVAVRFADDLVILIGSYRRHDWLMKALNQRLREELVGFESRLTRRKSQAGQPRRGGQFLTL